MSTETIAPAVPTRTGALASVTHFDPAAIAVSTPDGGLTYGELDSWSNRLARVLLDNGAGPGTTVAMAVEPTIESAVTRWAIAKSGATPVLAASGPAAVESAALGVTTYARRGELTDAIGWLVLDDRSMLVRYLTGSDAPITDAEREPMRRAS
ncbi:AMP-binding protein [Nocardia amikacinitolerans]|uniref:AMP-binding protein n=1 Tax=Nocardia amikacinitolerans TaxID=756689 RepID=UPI0020A501A7|nr:AMP-binding protein [Nocardia amikacinitolerans]MCP2280345.1 AMP-binding enzyme [Nocardia amikacinitolerans]